MKEFQKSSKTQIRIERSEWKGNHRVDVREYYLDEEDCWRPTKRGIAIPIELRDEIADAIRGA